MFARTLLTFLGLAAAGLCQLEVIATGLQSPQKVIVTPGGNLLVTETTTRPNECRVSLVTPAGARSTLIEGLPSGTEVTGGPSGPTAMALRGRTLYIAIGGGDAERRGETAGTAIHNPQGRSSALFASILRFNFDAAVDEPAGAFRMTTAHQQALRDGGDVRIEDGSGRALSVNALVRLPISEPDPNTVYRFSNPWGLALSDDGSVLWTVDASMNALLRVETASGRWQRMLRFPPTPNPGPVGPPMIDSVPTSVRVYGSELLVSFLTGFPFVPGMAHVQTVDPVQRTSNPFMFGLTSVVDVLWRDRGASRAQFFVLEFSTNQPRSHPLPAGCCGSTHRPPRSLPPTFAHPSAWRWTPRPTRCMF